MRFVPTILLSLFLFVVPRLVIASDKYEVAATKLNVRSGPSVEYSVIGQLNYGDVISVVDKSNSNWFQIETNEGVGYISSRYLRVRKKGDAKTSLVSSKDIQIEYPILIIAFIAAVILIFYRLFKRWKFKNKRKRRRNYYRNVYLKSDDWNRKRYVVLKRDNWRCVYCGERATQVHHKKYARKNIGKEPIKWLVSVCKSCHDRLHS